MPYPLDLLAYSYYPDLRLAKIAVMTKLQAFQIASTICQSSNLFDLPPPYISMSIPMSMLAIISSSMLRLPRIGMPDGVNF